MGNTILHAALIYGNVKTEVAVTAATTQREAVKFRLLHKACGTPIAQPRMCPSCQIAPMTSELVRGWEFAKGQFALIENEEYEKVRKHREPVVRIDKFVTWDSIPLYLPVKATYYLLDENRLLPSYALLNQTMFELEVDGLGSCNLWDKERPFRLIAGPEGLRLQTLFSADELVFIEPTPSTDLDDQFVDLTRALIQERVEPFSYDDLVVEEDRLMRKLVEAKAVGKPAPKLVKEAQVPPTTDLLATLRSSIKSKPPAKKKKVTA